MFFQVLDCWKGSQSGDSFWKDPLIAKFLAMKSSFISRSYILEDEYIAVEHHIWDKGGWGWVGGWVGGGVSIRSYKASYILALCRLPDLGCLRNRTSLSKARHLVILRQECRMMLIWNWTFRDQNNIQLFCMQQTKKQCPSNKAQVNTSETPTQAFSSRPR